MIKRITNIFRNLKQYILYILGPKKSIQQILNELAEEAERNGCTTLKQGIKLPVESLRLVWNKDKK